jgi:hypothetical protein
MSKLIRDITTTSRHFHALENVPIVGETDTLASAFRQMEQHKTSFVAVQVSPQHFRFVDDKYLFSALNKRLSSALDKPLALETPMLSVSETALLMPTISTTDADTIVSEVFKGAFAETPATVLDVGKPFGIWTPYEDVDKRMFTPAPIHYCPLKHPNPPPKPQSCGTCGLVM